MIIFGLVFYLGFALVFAFVVCWVFRFILNPLQIPNEASAEFKRERNLSYLIFLALTLSLYGVLLLAIIYLMGLVRHVMLQSRNAGATHIDQSRIIPRFKLSELLVMVFSLGVMPLVFQLVTWETEKEASLWIMILALVLFPACFLCALYRLEYNQVPSGMMRSFALALTPYAFLSAMSIPLSMLFCVMINFGNMQARHGPPPQVYIWLALSVVVLAITRGLYKSAYDASQENLRAANLLDPPIPIDPPIP